MDLAKTAQSTYDRVSRAKDHGASGPSPHLAAQRAVQDAVMAERHRCFDLSAKDRHMKFERTHFAVVGEGTKKAQELYREGWERIFGKAKEK